MEGFCQIVLCETRTGNVLGVCGRFRDEAEALGALPVKQLLLREELESGSVALRVLCGGLQIWPKLAGLEVPG